MTILHEGYVSVDQEESSFLQYVKSPDFPWFFYYVTPNNVGMVHTFMKRSSDTPDRGIENSQYFPIVEKLFLRTCKDNNIPVKTILRMAFNLTFHEPQKYADIHTDHDFPHKSFIFYIYADHGGDTFLFDTQGNLKETIRAETGKFVVFDGDPHAQGFCAPQGIRMVMVVTFDGGENE